MLPKFQLRKWLHNSSREIINKFKLWKKQNGEQKQTEKNQLMNTKLGEKHIFWKNNRKPKDWIWWKYGWILWQNCKTLHNKHKKLHVRRREETKISDEIE